MPFTPSLGTDLPPAIRAARDHLKSSGWSYRSAAKFLGVSYQHISEVLNCHRESRSLEARIQSLPVKNRSDADRFSGKPTKEGSSSVNRAPQDSLEWIAERLAEEKQEISAFDALARNLRIGLLCLKGHRATAVTDPKDRNPGFHKTASGNVARATFGGWLAANAPWLKRPTAFGYMDAVRGLGLDHEADEAGLYLALSKAFAEATRTGSPAPSIESLQKAYKRRA
jgi:transcriptional regulator with XRE-family HTH domain